MLRSIVVNRTPAAFLKKARGADAQRNPLLLFLLVGSLLLRLAEWKLSGLVLFQEPPRQVA
jgi:hypothetical protein